MSNRFTGLVMRRLKLDGWIDPDEHARLVARVKELECRLDEVAQERDDAIQQRDEFQQHDIHTHNILGSILGTNDTLENCAIKMVHTLHQRDTALVECRKALEKVHEWYEDKYPYATDFLEDIQPTIDHALSQIQWVKP